MSISRRGAQEPVNYRFTSAGNCCVMTPLIFVTGGVVSSLGKGIASASLAAILEARISGHDATRVKRMLGVSK